MRIAGRGRVPPVQGRGQARTVQRRPRRALVARFIVFCLHGSSPLRRSCHAFRTAALTARAANLLSLPSASASARRSTKSRGSRAARTDGGDSLLALGRAGPRTTAAAALRSSPCSSLAAIGAACFLRHAELWLPPLAAMSLSAHAGAAADRSKALAGSGILVTLGTAALSSALLGRAGVGIRQSAVLAALGGAGWEVFLPASLVFLLLSLGQDAAPRHSADSGALDATDGSSGKNAINETFTPALAIKRLAPPFVVACLGSVLGCAASFFVSRQGWGFDTAPRGRASHMLLLLPPADAAVAAACLAASFVGGSVNFFATAAIVIGPDADPRARALVSSVAAVDLIVMAAYFASLGAMLQSKRLRKWFGEDEDPEERAESSPAAAVRAGQDVARRALVADRNRMRRWQSNGVGVILASALALQVVRAARVVERLLAPIVPGTACAFIAMAVPVLQRLPFTRNAIWTNMQRVSRPLSTYSFLWLFATIGMSIDVTEALREGPACLVFSMAALAVHVGVTLLGCWLLGWQRRNRRDFGSDVGGARSAIRLEEALIASNAAIGGPATAAVFCGQLPDSNRRRAGLTVAATAYGVVGYGIGTTIGVAMFRWFTSLI